MRQLPRPLLPILLAACGLALAACSSPSRHERAEAEPAAPKPIAMRGENTFFDGALRAELTVSRGRTVPFAGKGGGEGGSGRKHHRGGDDEADPTYYNVYSHTGDKDKDKDDPIAIIQVGGWGPAVTIKLKLENTSKATMAVEIRDLNSDLGNFAVRPDKVSLAPGQSVEPDPMVSELGVTSDTIPVSLTLRYKGKTEKRDVVLVNLFTPGSTPPAAPAK